VRVIVGFPAGGSADLSARLISPRFPNQLTEDLVVPTPALGGITANIIL